MPLNKTWSLWVLIMSVVLVGFAIPHFVDDFLYNVPEEFNLSNPQAQVLGGIFFALLTLSISLAARKEKRGYYGTAFFGFFLTAAAGLKHLDRILEPGPYWGGLISELSILGLMLSGLILGVVSLLAIRASRN